MHDEQRGFTLLELMLVVTIIGILAAIGLVTFLRSRDSAIDAAARSLLTEGVQAVRVASSDGHGLAATKTEVTAAEPTIHWLDETGVAEAAHHDVSVAIGTQSGQRYVILATHTANRDCLAVRVDDALARYQRVAGDVCPANAFDPSFGWVSEWPPR